MNASRGSGPGTMLLAAGLLALVLGGPGCAADPAAADTPAGTAAPSWQQAMARIGDHRDRIESELARPGGGDLDRVAGDARAAARLVALGYGAREQPGVPGFADLARECEAWLLQVALEADQGRLALARDLYRQSARHCTRCHDAAGRRQW